MPSTSVHAVRWILGLLCVVFGVYLVVVPVLWSAWEAWIVIPDRPAIRRLDDDISRADWFRLKSVEMAMAMIFFALGASVGSFLNVVVYRLPNRVPLFLRRSRCPNCQNAIPAKDNLPLIGWLRLGGRCRQCSSPISIRYPLIEGLMGSVFLLLYSVQLISGGLNLPNRLPNLYAGVVWVLFYIKWDLVGLYFYHCLLLAMLLVLGLIDYDRRRLTGRQILIGTTWLVVPALAFPGLLLWRLGIWDNQVVNALSTVGCGAAVGAAIGWTMAISRGLTAGLAWIGVALGWQAVVGVTCMVLLLRLITLTTGLLVSRQSSAGMGFLSSPATWTLWLFLGTLIHHGLWRWLTDLAEPYWPGGVVNGWLIGVWAVGFAGLFWANRGLSWGLSLRDSGSLEAPMTEGN